MKTLFVLRHAKSSWDDPDLEDFDRPLNHRGRAAAPFMGKLMAREGLVPDLILSSPAARARETARLAREAGNLSAEIEYIEEIYEASAQTLRQIAAGIDDLFPSAMIVGHNPGMEGLVGTLTGKLDAMPTAALAVIDLDITSWSDVAAGKGTLRRLLRPKEEKARGKGL